MLTDIKTKELLDLLYRKYNIKESSTDPVWNLELLPTAADLEIAAFIISCYSYGGITQINRFTRKVFDYAGYGMYEFMRSYSPKKRLHAGFAYRFNTNDDFFGLINSISRVIKEYGSLKNLFLVKYNKGDENIIPALTNFSEILRKYGGKSDTFGYLIPRVKDGSTCKRLNLFLRWMVRKDNVDYGLWGKEVDTSKLLMPVDIHVYRQSQKLKLVKRKTCDLKYAVELTEKLKKYDAKDPVKYDFALCHLGIDNRS
ncbi:MAG: TIGR02757 family protein [Ignavibacteria bacterium]|nr:TIGR02757 family protein [Ignavibacteria bacterium]